jgi:DNA-binding transcriptional LysR family regulator
MDIELLRTFLEVKNTRHFGKAAENLYLTQAAVSARIKQLESIIGGPLFTRFRNNLQLTVTGERLINHAETILIAWERAKQEVSIKKRHKHTFSLGGTSGLWDLLLQDVLHKIHQSFPTLPLRAEAHGPDTLIRYLMERTLDLALIYEPAKLTDIVSIALSPAELILVSSRANLLVNEVLQTDYIAVDWGQNFQASFTQLFPDAGAPALQTSLAKIGLEFIHQYGGSAYLPYHMIESDLDSSLFQVSDAPIISRQIYACYHKDNLYLTEIEAVIDLIRAQHQTLDADASDIAL